MITIPLKDVRGFHSDDEESPSVEKKRRDCIMNQAFDTWVHDYDNGDEYTPPWIHLPHELTEK